MSDQYYEKYKNIKLKYINLKNKYIMNGGSESVPKKNKLGLKISIQPRETIVIQPIVTTNICPIISPIIPGLLYLGNQYNATDECLAPYNIKAIVNITTEASKNSTLVNLQIPLEDTHDSNIMQYFDITYDFIDSYISKNLPIYVHCKEGISRSATIIIAYLMRKQKITLEEALTLVKEKRPVINPNMGFVYSLKEYENKLKL